MKKLPVFASVGEVFSGVTRHYFQLLFVSWPSMLVIVALGGFIGAMYSKAGYVAALTADGGKPDLDAVIAAQARLYSGSAGLLLAGAFLLLVLASSVAAVRWHRLVLLGEGAGSPVHVRFLRAEDWRYIWTYIKVALIFAVLLLIVAIVIASLSFLKAHSQPASSGPLMLIAGPAFLFFYFWAMALYMRFSLALPDAALGMGGRVRTIFKATKGNGLRLLGYFLVFGLALSLISIVTILVIGIAASVVVKIVGIQVALVLGLIVYAALYMYFLMTGITMLSVAYRELVGLTSETEPGRALPG
jgi:hypothetical protein